MLYAKNDASWQWLLSKLLTNDLTDWTSESYVNFCPVSIFLHQMCIVGFVKHLSPYTGVNFICTYFFCPPKANHNMLFVMGQI